MVGRRLAWALLLGAAGALQLGPGLVSRGALHRSADTRASALAMAGFSPFYAIKGTVERLTDFRVARASHILLKSFEEDAVQQMRQWKSQIADDPDAFATRARESSQCPSRVKGESPFPRRPRAPSRNWAWPGGAHCPLTTLPAPLRAGGELGFFTRGKMVREFDSVVFSEEPGFVYGPGEGRRAPRPVRARTSSCEPAMFPPHAPPPSYHAPPLRCFCASLALDDAAHTVPRPCTAASCDCRFAQHPFKSPTLTRASRAVRTDFGHHLIFIHSCREPKEA